MLKQSDIFGELTDIDYGKHPSLLPTPINDWAYAVYIILNSPKGVNVLEAAYKWGVVKFQERLNEVLKKYPEIAIKKMVTVKKRMGKKVDVMLYSINDREKAVEVYFKINQKNGSKILNQ